MFKLALNAGHGYQTAGKRCLKSIDPNETREYVLNKRIADKIQNKLSAYNGIQILRIDNGTDIAISTRAKSANNFGADFYLAIHHNAGINGGSGGGTEVYVYLKVDEKTKQWQSDIYNSVVASTGLKGNRSQPLRQADLGECRETSMPAVLIECGFMDSTVDTPIILTDEFAEKTANAITSVIVKKAGLTSKESAYGYLDGVDLNHIYGWAANTIHDESIEVHAYIYNSKNEVISVIPYKANQYREDLVKAGIGNGKHGFDIAYKFSELSPDTYTVKVFAITSNGSNPQLTNTYNVKVDPKPTVTEEKKDDPIEEISEKNQINDNNSVNINNDEKNEDLIENVVSDNNNNNTENENDDIIDNIEDNKIGKVEVDKTETITKDNILAIIIKAIIDLIKKILKGED